MIPPAAEGLAGLLAGADCLGETAEAAPPIEVPHSGQNFPGEAAPQFVQNFPAGLAAGEETGALRTGDGAATGAGAGAATLAGEETAAGAGAAALAGEATEAPPPLLES